jgi:hypothetical protein
VESRLYAHGAPASVTVYTSPAIVRVPTRGLPDGFGCATNCTSPVPPDADEAIDSHDGSLLTAGHEHTAGAETPTAPAPPDAGTLPTADCKLKVHAVPACWMFAVWLLMVSAPFRGATDDAFD